MKKETYPLREKRGRRASLTTKGESGAFGKERSLKTHLAAHWRATSGDVAERPGFARRQTPTLAPRASRPPRQPSPRRLRPRNQGTQRTSGRRGRKPTRRPAGSPRTHGSVRRNRRDPRSKNKESARSILPRARRTPSLSQWAQVRMRHTPRAGAAARIADASFGLLFNRRIGLDTMVVNGSMPPVKVRPHPVAALVRTLRLFGAAP